MAHAPTGIIGKTVAQRPMLTTVILALGLTALSVAGIRQSRLAGDSDMLTALVATGAYVVCAPFALFAVTPRRSINQLLYRGLIVLLTGVIAAASLNVIALPAYLQPPLFLTASVAAFFIFLAVLSPIVSSVTRLGFVAPFAGLLGAAGGAGYLAYESMLGSPSAAPIIAIALVVGGVTGFNVAAEFSKQFAKGANQEQAAGAACHGAIAPMIFAILSAIAFTTVDTVNANFGAVEWSVLWGGLCAVILAALSALVGVTGSLSLMRVSEQVAVNENRRRDWFLNEWRPIRRTLPATSALAAAAIAGVLVVIAAFEVGVATPWSFLAFLSFVGASAALAFVSLRTSILVFVILFASALLGDYIYALLKSEAMTLSARFAALTLMGISLGQLTISWRDAGEIWRNARDVAQNAMADGLQRYLTSLAFGVASLITVAYAFSWQAGYDAAVYYGLTGCLGLVLAPIMMVAMSSKTTTY